MKCPRMKRPHVPKRYSDIEIVPGGKGATVFYRPRRKNESKNQGDRDDKEKIVGNCCSKHSYFALAFH